MKKEMTDEQRLKIIAVLEDIQHNYMVDMKPGAKQLVKQYLNKSIKVTSNLIAEFYKIFEIKDQEEFECGSDDLKNMIESHIFK